VVAKQGKGEVGQMAAESYEGKWPMQGRLGGSMDGPCDGYTDGELYHGQHQGVGWKGVMLVVTRLGWIMWQQLQAWGGQAVAVHWAGQWEFLNGWRQLVPVSKYTHGLTHKHGLQQVQVSMGHSSSWCSRI
jgi:hypothetical protein